MQAEFVTRLPNAFKIDRSDRGAARRARAFETEASSANIGAATAQLLP
jgi:hypothetical protein